MQALLLASQSSWRLSGKRWATLDGSRERTSSSSTDSLRGKFDRLPNLAADLVRLKVDLIMVSATSPALAVKSATTTIPVVMTNIGDPVGAGLVASLARPGGNVTGFSSLSPELNTKRLEILKDAVLSLSRVGLLRTGAGIVRDLQLKELRVAASALKLTLEEIDAPSNAKRLGERLSNRKAETGGSDYDTRQSLLFWRKKADRRACRQVEVASYLLPEGVCRCGRPVLRCRLH
jgi:ABC transporter substrate binding protein